jgi:hypothetical protein
MSENKMKEAFLHRPGARRLVVSCAIALAAGCMGRITSDDAPRGSSKGNGNGAPGAGPSVGSGGTGAAAMGGMAGAPVDVGTVVVNPPPFTPAPAMLRRLTRTQFRNAMKDVFNYTVDINTLDADSWDANMATIGAAVVVTSDQGAEQYVAAVENAVNAVFSDATKRATFLGCTPTGQSTDTCLRGFVQKLGLRAWRRPLATAEVDRLATLAASASTTLGSAVEGARWATVALFESPDFLYRPELGAPSADGSMRFSAYEMAGRLSLLIWNSIPDQMLMDQAASGMLSTADGIRSAASRMLDATAGRESVGNFAEEFLRLDRIATQAKDPSLFPDYNASLQAAMVRDVRDTWASLVFDDQASVMDLFTTTKVVVNSDLAKLYGLDATGLTPTTFQVKSLPASGPRAGLLSKAGLLSEFANQQFGSPTLRGKFMRESLMCLTVPPPPPGVNQGAVDQPTDVPMTRRQRLEMHRAAAACAGCHALMDPLGLPLESFDAIGKYRTTDNGLPVDPTSSFDGQPVADSRALGAVASQSVAVAQCLVRKYYAYAVGHEERDADGSVLNSLATAFKAAGFKMRDLILAVVSSDAFATVAPQP